MRNLSLLSLILALTALPALAQEAKPSGDRVRIQLAKDLTIAEMLDTISKTTGTPMLYDPSSTRIARVKLGSAFDVTVSRGRLLDTYRAILSFFELTMIPVGPKEYEIYLVVDSHSTNNLIKNKMLFVPPDKLEEYADKDGTYIGTALPVHHIENLTTLRTALSTMVSPAGIGRVHEVPGSHALIVMDFAPTVVAISRLIALIDKPAASEQPGMGVVELKYARAVDMAAALTKLLEQPAPVPHPSRRSTASSKRSLAPKVIAYEPRNAIVIRGLPADVESIKAVVALLDLPPRAWKAG